MCTLTSINHKNTSHLHVACDTLKKCIKIVSYIILLCKVRHINCARKIYSADKSLKLFPTFSPSVKFHSISRMHPLLLWPLSLHLMGNNIVILLALNSIRSPLRTLCSIPRK